MNVFNAPMLWLLVGLLFASVTIAVFLDGFAFGLTGGNERGYAESHPIRSFVFPLVGFGAVGYIIMATGISILNSRRR
ncbi:MAG: hypothetical protein ACI9TZ_002367 [Yoonia sp.]